jgi:glycosyltransferase involved in cell wall biosynthesis
VDSGSTDSTLNIAKTYGAKIINLDPPFNYSRSLNLGISVARGDWVCVLSSHCIPADSSLLLQIREVISEIATDVALIYGRTPLIMPPKSPEPLQFFDMNTWNSFHVSGGNTFAIYPMAMLERRPFDEKLITAEDLDWLLWALGEGYRGVKANELIALYRNQGSVCYMFQKGWKEVLTSQSLRQIRPSPPRVVRHTKSLLMTFARVVKLGVTSKIDWSSALKGAAHALGAACAGILSDLGLIDRFLPPNDTPHGSGT